LARPLSCINCRKKIPIARIEALPNATRCAPCQEKYELGNPGSITRKAPENPIGSREDFKSMSNKQFGTNIKSKF
jgi:RNA polymerase-binding transcription factor DksA